jgi:SAM-dependent methyltransferase
MTDPKVTTGHLARSFLNRGDAQGWFEAVYASADWDEASVPWAHLAPNPGLAGWLKHNQLIGAGRSALVIGCGLGDDAEELARLGFEVTAFDISATAIKWCRKRFPRSTVNYRVADLLEPVESWPTQFDFVLEAHTIQALPPTELRQQAIKAVSRFVAAGGTLLVTCLGSDPSSIYEGPPWPVTKSELHGFIEQGLREIRFETYRDQHAVRRFRVEYRV